MSLLLVLCLSLPEPPTFTLPPNRGFRCEWSDFDTITVQGTRTTSTYTIGAEMLVGRGGSGWVWQMRVVKMVNWAEWDRWEYSPDVYRTKREAIESVRRRWSDIRLPLYGK